MTERNSDQKKTIIKNQLFNVSVTGGTFEDFSQNAILLPASNLPSTSTNTPSEIPLVTPPPPQSSILENTLAIDDFQELQPQEQNKSQLSTVFSSISNILSFGAPLPSDSVPFFEQPPTNLNTAIGKDDETNTAIEENHSYSVLPPVPSNFVHVKPNIPPQGPPGNLYRRSGSRKPAYAQVPGLVSSRNASIDQQHISSASDFNNPVPPGQSQEQSCLYPNYFQPIPGATSAHSLNITTSASDSNILSPLSSKDIEISNILQSVPSNLFHSSNSNTEQTSAILKPALPDNVLQSVPDLSCRTHLDSSNLIFPQADASIFSPPPPPQTSAAIPLFNPSLISSGHLTSPVMAALSESEVLPSNGGSTTLPNPSPHLSFGNPNGSSATSSSIYRPVYHHWFLKKIIEGRTLWQPFSMLDSLTLEEVFTSPDISPEKVVATDGGRYDVNILRRERYPVYWTAAPTEVRRCSWFYKRSNDGRFVPYEENIATMLENEFKTAFETREWHRKVELPNGEAVVFHGPDVLVLFPPTHSPDTWGNTPQTQPKPRVVKRGLDEFDIEEGEPAKVDHLLFVVHGIGSVCDLKFRTVEEVVDEFRSIALQLVNSHYHTSCNNGIVNRMEVLPISWHSKLHSEDTGVDKNLKNITLESIPRLRDFTNDTLLDILFYTSPIYSQTIISTVGTELNRLYELFKERNPTFCGGVSLSGHSLGSLILFDLLSHQKTPEPEKERTFNTGEDDVVPPLKKPHPKDRRLSRRISYMMSEAGTGQPELIYPHLHFHPVAFFALGSPIGMFITVRGLDKLGDDFALPTCPGFFNIFHPYDPVAYRIESLINPELANLKPVLIPHHKGRKRMHLELKETMTRVGADLKQKLIDSMKNTWNTFFQIALFGKQDNSAAVNLEVEVDKVLEKQLAEEEEKQTTETQLQTMEDQNTDLYLGMLNKGRRIDYVLQEAPLEFFNEYLFALTSHVGYWESEDTILLILREIYNATGIIPDTQVPQPTMTIQRPSSSPKNVNNSVLVVNDQAGAMGMDPTAPMLPNVNIGPPPTSGFVRK